MPEADDPTVADEGQAEAPQSEAEEPTSTETPPPWGDDFDAERAWRTITHQRDREKELEPLAKTFERLQKGEDRDTFRTLAEQYGYEIPDDDDEPEPEDEVEDDPVAKRLEEIEKKVQEREAAEAAKAFEDHLDQLASGKEVELTARQRKQILRDSLEAGFNPESTEKAFNDLVEELTEYEKRAIERYTGSKRAPQSPGSSKSATQVPDLDDPKQRAAWLKEQVALRERS